MPEEYIERAVVVRIGAPGTYKVEYIGTNGLVREARGVFLNREEAELHAEACLGSPLPR